MISIELRRAITDVTEILEHMDIKDVEKIPAKFMKFLQDNKSTYYKPNLDHTKKLCEMELSNKTKSLLAFLYLNFWCNETEKLDAIKTLKMNESKI